MAFTANEMVKAIDNAGLSNDLANRFERAAFAAYLADSYGADNETAEETIVDLTTSHTEYEGDRITFWTRDLLEYREQADA